MRIDELNDTIEIFHIKKEYQDLSVKKKLEGLDLLSRWIISEKDKLKIKDQTSIA